VVFGLDTVTLPSPGAVYLGFSTQKGAISWFIRWATASPASHSFLLYWSEQFQQHMVLEVQGRGFVQVPWTGWTGKNKLLAFYEIDRSEETIDEAMKKLGARLGDSYDNLSLLGFLFVFVFKIWDRNDLDDKEKLVCSEMVALFFRWADIPLSTHIDRVVPRDLIKLARESDVFVERYIHKSLKRKIEKVIKRGNSLVEEDAEVR